MPVLADWYDSAETIKHWQFIDPWHAQDYFDVLSDAIAVSSQKPYNIATIMDFTQAAGRRSNALNLMKIGGKHTPPNLELVVFVGNHFVASMVSMYQQINPLIHYDLLICTTLAEAVQSIIAYRNHEKYV